MANLFTYIIFALVFLFLGGESDDLYKDNQTSQSIYLDSSSFDLDNDSSDHNAVAFTLKLFDLHSQSSRLDTLYNFSVNVLSIQSFLIRAPPSFN